MDVWTTDLEHDVRIGPDRFGISGDIAADLSIGIVGKIGIVAGTGFHGYRETELDEFFGHLRHGCNTLLSGVYFFGNPNSHKTYSS